MTKLKAGDAVQVTARDQTPSDIKSGLYYTHFGNLKGAILKLYGEEASVLVDRDTLPAEIRVRHDEGEKAMRQRWLDGLSEEARNRMGAREKDFTLNYAVLVAVADLTPDTGKKSGAPAPLAASREEKQNAKEAAKSMGAVNVSTGASTNEAPSRRLSPDDLDSNEAAFLASRGTSGL